MDFCILLFAKLIVFRHLRLELIRLKTLVYFVFACDTCFQMNYMNNKSKKYCALVGSKHDFDLDVEKGRLNIVLKMDILWKKFPDGFPNLFIQVCYTV